MTWKIGLWIARIAATVALAALLSVWTTGYVVTSYVQALLKQYEIPLEVEPVALADVWGMLWGTQAEEVESAAIADQMLSVEKQPEAVGPDYNDQQEEEVLDSSNDIEEQANEEQTDESLDPVAEQQEAEDQWQQDAVDVLAPVETGSEPTITPEDIDASKEQLTAEDKERMFEILMLKLPSDSWQMFSTYIEDGLTDQELIDIQQVMAQHLSKEEYEELIEILKKY